VLILAMVIFSVVVALIGSLGLDGVRRSQARAQFADAVDLSALAAAGAISEGSNPDASASEILRANLGSSASKLTRFDLQQGRWDSNKGVFQPGGRPVNAVQILSERECDDNVFAPNGQTRPTITESAVAYFAQRDVVLVLDVSGSMKNENRIEALREAVKQFCDVITSSSNGQDRTAIVTYSDKATLAVPLTSSVSELRDCAARLDPGGATNIGDGIDVALKHLKKSGRDSTEKVIVLLTDGLANRPSDDDPKELTRRQTRLAKKESITLTAISFGSNADRTLMTEVAALGEGDYFHASSGVDTELVRIFRTIAASRRPHLVK
jgi:Mg-chelatase subunit ChlD